jgi:hypothetical protein
MTWLGGAIAGAPQRAPASTYANGSSDAMNVDELFARIKGRAREQADDLALLEALLAADALSPGSPVPLGERWLSSSEASAIASGAARSTLIRWAVRYGIGFQRATGEWIFLETKLRGFLNGTLKKGCGS